MKNNTKLVIISALTAFSLIGAASSTIAWFNTRVDVDMFDNVTGISNGAYFARGTGESDDPFIINSPVHLYNLAWLQYLGYFNNNTTGISAESGPTYFALDPDLNAPLDMTGWILPPIGTTLNPFVGVFNGNGKIIANLTTINSTNKNDYPKKPYIVRHSESVDNVNVLGLFGVVGTCNLEGTDVVPIYPDDGYSANAISNFYIDNGHVKNYQESTLAGIAAGYVNAPMSDVGILSSATTAANQSQIDLSEKTPTSVYGGKTNISDFTSVGFCEDAYKTSVAKNSMEIYEPVSTQASSAFTAEQAGDKEGFGGSIGMDELFNRLETFRGSSYYTQVRLPEEVTGEYHYYNNGVEDLTKSHDITTASETVTSYEYYNGNIPLQGRVVFGQQPANYLWGTRQYTRDYTITNEYHTDADPIVYYGTGVRNGTTYYLRFQGGNASANQTEANKTLLYEDADGWVYYLYGNNNTKYYLYASNTTNGTLRSSNSKQTYMFRFVNNHTQLQLYQNNTNLTSYGRYVRFNNGSFSIDNNSTGITLNQTTIFRTETTTDASRQIKHYTHGTYLPLNVYTSEDQLSTVSQKFTELGETAATNGAKLNNTGYIVGGTKSMTDNYGSGVRVASNYNYSDISRALGGASSYSGSNLQVLTRTKNSNGVVFISDSFNSETDLSANLNSLSYVSTTGTGTNKKARKETVEDLGLQRYSASRANLDKQFKANTTTLYCMRFNEFQISKDNTITAEKVLLNGEIKENYVLPESCIDFNLKEKGFINFFGGGYRGGTCDAFFSLFHIIRDDNDNILSLKRLSKIYGTNNEKDPYAYEYVDGTFSIYDKEEEAYDTSITAVPDGYTMHFDLKWVEEPGFTAVDNTVWYFEIPTNIGEYALGSAVNTKTSTGGYMFYLDVGANAANVYRSTVVELINKIAEEFSRPLGVAIVAGTTSTSIDTANSYCVTVEINSTGVIYVSRESDIAASYTESNPSEYIFLSYAYDSLVVSDENGKALTPTAISSVEENIKRVTYLDYTPNDDSTTETILSRVTTTDSSSSTSSTETVVKQYKYYGTDDQAEETDTVIVYNNDGLIIQSKTEGNRIGYGTDEFFAPYTSPSVDDDPLHSFSFYYEGVGTVTMDIVLTTYIKETDICDMYSAKGYNITIYLTDNDGKTTNMIGSFTIFPDDYEDYLTAVLDGTGENAKVSYYTLIIDIFDEYIENLVADS